MGTSFQTQCNYLKQMKNSMPLQFVPFSWKGSVYDQFPIDRKAAKGGVLMSVILTWSQVASFTRMWNQSRWKVLSRTDKKGHKENNIAQGDKILARTIIVSSTLKTSPILVCLVPVPVPFPDSGFLFSMCPGATRVFKIFPKAQR